MFDKEAEDKAFEKYPFPTNWGSIDLERNTKYEEGFKDGAEFVYNKANEWHYVKDGLPKELHDVLCFVIHNEHRFVLHGYLRDGRWVLSPLGTYLNNDDVIAWKEIVLPKEIE